LMLVFSVKIRRNGARANIGTIPDHRIP